MKLLDIFKSKNSPKPHFAIPSESVPAPVVVVPETIESRVEKLLKNEDIRKTAGNMPTDVLKKVLTANLDLQAWGWCQPLKAAALAQSVYDVRPRLVVEIGIFGGRSLLPLAIALKGVGEGVVYGIEPWSNAIAIETPTTAENDEWWKNVDLAGAKRACLQQILKSDVVAQAKLLECRSSEAMTFLAGKIDMIHVDGNHSAEQALVDVRVAYDAVRPQGYIWMDDIRWPSVKPALEFLHTHCEVIREFFARKQSCYGFYRKKS